MASQLENKTLTFMSYPSKEKLKKTKPENQLGIIYALWWNLDCG